MGAAAAAARALTSHSDNEERESEPTGEAAEASAAEQESPEAEPRPDRDEPAAETEEAPAADHESPQAEPRPSRDVGKDRGEEPVRGASPDEATETVQRARQQLSALLERPVESVSAFERTHDGWLVTLEVLELSRIPESTDVLASYELELDDDRKLRRYARVRRYSRSQADRGDQQ
ncbi:MAG: gas vesicle protein [Actinobacteria bacterium]|nr:MAG: gas vesicle protein [Actinomycetota bacterium]